MLRRLLLPALLVAGLLAAPAIAHLDHGAPGRAPSAPPSPAFASGGEDAEWEMLGSIFTGNPHSDLDFFTRGGSTYAAVGTLGTGPNAGGVTFVRLSGADGQVKPEYVSGHGSATCFSNPADTLGLQHDVEATPKGGVVLGQFNPQADKREAELVVDATDASGRCHDQGALSLSGAPQGGLELIDVTNPLRPVEIGLTTHVGEAHTVNIDPRRPHIAYAVTSDSVGVNAQGVRANEAGGNALDGWEVVDMSSCMGFPAGTSVEEKRAACRPEVFRYRYPTPDIVRGHTNKGTIYGCHELEVYPDDKLTCGSGSAAILFDIAGTFDDNGTPNDFTDDKPRGTKLDCPVRKSSSAGPFATAAMVVDCGAAKFQVAQWLKDGAPSLEGVQHIGSAFHMGRESLTGAATPDFPSTEDIDFDHEAELTTSRRFILATDERGGGVVPPGSSCAPGADNPTGNGGVHAYRVDKLKKTTPATAEAAFESYARTSKGGKAIFRAPVRTKPQAALCTAHVFQQIPGQNRIFMGWYSQGTEVIDYTENEDGTLDFKEVGYFRPENANQWVSHVFKAQREPDGRFTYFGATGDFYVGDGGRGSIDVYKVTLPAPPAPRGGTGTQGEPPAAPPAARPPAGTPGAGTQPGASKPCKVSAGFRSATARPTGRSLRFSFERLLRRPVTVDVFRQSAGRRITGERRVARFTRRTSAFTWSPRRLGEGVYVARLTMDLGRGRRDVRRVALERRDGRFKLRPDYYRRASCGLVSAAKLERPVFGGRSSTALLASFRLSEDAAVRVIVRDARGRVVRRFAERTYLADRAVRLRVAAGKLRRGLVRVELRARRGAQQVTVRLAARRL